MADIVLVAKFVQSNDQIFSDYINYMDREQAKQSNVGYQTAFSAFQDYMGDEEKTGGLFDNWNESLNDRQMERYKEQFSKSQEDGGNMWQQVISFTPEFLIENKINVNGKVQEDILKQATRKAITAQLKAEGMLGNVIWNGAIHYNTDNIHVHIAFVEKEVTRTRGKLKGSSLNKAKSAILAELVPRTQEKMLLNEQRARLVNTAKENTDRLIIAKSVRTIQKQLPKKGRLQYNSSHISDEFRNMIDVETMYLFQTVLKNEYETYIDTVKQEEAFYQKSYGAGSSELYQDYTKNKAKEIYARIGNVLLKEAVQMRREAQKKERTNNWERHIAELRQRSQLKHELRKVIEQARRETEKEIQEADQAFLGYSL